MLDKVPYLIDCIDLDSPDAPKYIGTVSVPDSCRHSDIHHIVPVAYYEDVLGETVTRRAKSPDMHPDNLVRLSKGHHLKAHYYLSRCALPCILPQMACAFSKMVRNKEYRDEESVLALVEEMDAYYENLMENGIPIKDGELVRQCPNCTSRTEYLSGKEVGYYAKWNREGILSEYRNNVTGTGASFEYSPDCYGNVKFFRVYTGDGSEAIFDSLAGGFQFRRGKTSLISTVARIMPRRLVAYGCYGIDSDLSGLPVEFLDFMVSFRGIVSEIFPAVAEEKLSKYDDLRRLEENALRHGGKLSLLGNPTPVMPKRTKPFKVAAAA